MLSQKIAKLNDKRESQETKYTLCSLANCALVALAFPPFGRTFPIKQLRKCEMVCPRSWSRDSISKSCIKKVYACHVNQEWLHLQKKVDITIIIADPYITWSSKTKMALHEETTKNKVMNSKQWFEKITLRICLADLTIISFVHISLRWGRCLVISATCVTKWE